MGLNFDERVPTMTDEELHAVNRQTLNRRSQLNLAREIAKRERQKAENDRKALKSAPKPEGPGVWIRWAVDKIVIICIAGATIAVTIAVAMYL